MRDAVLEEVRWELNDAGTLKYSLFQDSKNIAYPQLHVNEVQLWVDDRLLGWYFHEDEDGSPDKVTFDCTDLMGYLQYRFITNTSIDFDTATEQMQIAAYLVQKMQDGNPYQDFNLRVYPYAPSGVPRLRRYERSEHKNALELLKEFPTLADAYGNHTGFDIGMDYTSQPGNRLWRPYYPYKGQYKNQVILEWGVNLVDFSVKRQGKKHANRIYGTGGTNGDIKFEENRSIEASQGYYGEFQDVVSYGDEKDIDALIERINRDLSVRKDPVETVELRSVDTDHVELLKVLEVGDWVPVRINRGRTQVASFQRIQTISWKPGKNNLTIGFAGT
jgi:hypothetical protein